MDITQASMFLSGSILVMLGLVSIVCGLVLINNIINRYWKPIRFLQALDNYFAVNHGIGIVRPETTAKKTSRTKNTQ